MNIASGSKHNRIKLTGVKRGIYNPYLPTLRRIEMDNYLGRLSDEHVRTTLPPGVDTFSEDLFYQYYPPHKYLHGFDILPLCHREWREELQIKNLSFLQNPHLACKWEEFKRGLPVSEKRLINIPSLRNFHFMNYYLRYKKPDVTACYRMKMKPGPLLQEGNQCPIPADTHLQYRACY